MMLTIRSSPAFTWNETQAKLQTADWPFLTAQARRYLKSALMIEDPV